MAARKWTTEQRERQAALIRTWTPWTHSTGPRTPKGKQVSSKNAVNYSLREVMREIARQNRTLIGFINGTGSAPTFDRTVIDGLLDGLEKVVESRAPEAATLPRPRSISACVVGAPAPNTAATGATNLK